MNKHVDPLDQLTHLHNIAKAIISVKNHDYRGGSGDPYANFRGSAMFGVHPVIGVLIRIMDKMMRIKTFVEKGQLKVKNESVDDALVDITNYVALIRGLIKEEEQNGD